MAFRDAEDYLKIEHPHLFTGADPTATVPFPLSLPDAGVYVPLTSETWTSTYLAGYTLNPNGVLTYTDVGQVIVFVGLSRVTVNIADTLTYALFVNGSPQVESPHLFDVQSKTSNINDVGFVTLTTGSVMDVRIKSLTGNQNITVSNLKTIFK